MSKQKLWILSELFYPETTSTAYILTEIAKTLSEKYKIHVIAGNPVYDVNNDKNDLNNITIHRIQGKYVNKNNKIKRLLRAFFLVFDMVKVLKNNVHSIDKVLAVTNPVFLLLSVSKWCKKNKKNFCIIVHDIFPENAINTKIIKNKIIGNFLIRKFNVAYSNCSQIITCGNDMKEIISRKIHCDTNRICFIPNWANLSITPNYLISNPKIRIQFSGNMGRVQGLTDFFEILQQVDNNDVEFVFAGSGAMKTTLEEKVKFLKCNVVFLPPYKREEENDVLNNCNLALVTLDDSMYGLGVPSKTYNNMAAGKAILFIGPKNSDIYNEVSKNAIGFAFSFSERDSIITFLNGIKTSDKQKLIEMGRKARVRAESIYNMDIILQKYLEIV